MQKIKVLSVCLLLSIILIGCQNINNLNLNEDITHIEVYEWNSEKLMDTIEDQVFIEELTSELDNAKTHSTANIDWAMPDYQLLFKDDNEVLYEIGYCNEIQNFGSGAVGRYWESDKLYEVSTELPLE
ncbi:hypothetical protein SAMN05216389_11242 [Oceanobacillus limi]|uniref:Uncharacterized protein n=1 Tax=Oceanobacillus limi TaxID=930131 RepID=A0A1I0EQ95_9BACI|nr:hypothetical protein [Oceanobacillus limi]SET47505.1 hypothetical protein SAMN05216389_11242 [Oceanobacillus limi]